MILRGSRYVRLRIARHRQARRPKRMKPLATLDMFGAESCPPAHIAFDGPRRYSGEHRLLRSDECSVRSFTPERERTSACLSRSRSPKRGSRNSRLDECLALLRTNEIGRVGVIVGEFPVVLPVNYRLVESAGRNWVVLRTRPGGVIEQASMYVSFQIDGFDVDLRRGWSVLVRGILQPVNPDVAGFRERFDPDPWIATERDAWLIVEPFAITGRRVHN